MAEATNGTSQNNSTTQNNTTNQNNLIWLDMEMSGLLPDSDRILELAAVVTDAELNVLGESPVFVIHQADAVLDGMDAWNKGAHGRSGLIEKVKASKLDEATATLQMIEFLKQFVLSGKSPMCGNSICQDRRFMARYMPDLESYFHYRNLDVSVFKELARRWKPEIYSGFKKASKHEALADIYESIDELKYYREHFIVK
ncbi:MAG: oligoribonuclease [Methylotenera sp.]|nr:oligoribonuclease [Methylotenera sp.]